MGIRQYEVTVPPTSGEVEDEMLRAIGEQTMAIVHARTVEDDMPRIPREDDEVDLEFRIGATRHPEEGGMAILGHTEDGRTVNLSTNADPYQPATLSLVVD
jgi:hypothetical protein